VAGFSYAGTATSDNFALARYNADGTLDTTFGTGGLVTTNFSAASIDDAYSVVIQSDGRIILAGASNSGGELEFPLGRYYTGGRLHPSLRSLGLITNHFAGAHDNTPRAALQV